MGRVKLETIGLVLFDSPATISRRLVETGRKLLERAERNENGIYVVRRVRYPREIRRDVDALEDVDELVQIAAYRGEREKSVTCTGPYTRYYGRAELIELQSNAMLVGWELRWSWYDNGEWSVGRVYYVIPVPKAGSEVRIRAKWRVEELTTELFRQCSPDASVEHADVKNVIEREFEIRVE